MAAEDHHGAHGTRLPSGRVYLSVGLSDGWRVASIIAIWVFASAMSTVGLLFFLITDRFTDAQDDMLSSGPDDPQFDAARKHFDDAQTAGSSVAWAAGLFLITIAVVAFCLSASSITRSRMWLEGTTLVSRGFRTRRFDLATAVVSAGTVTEIRHQSNRPVTSGHVIFDSPAIFVREAVSGAQVAIPMKRRSGGHLPRHDLLALSNALVAGRNPADRSTTAALSIAQRLRTAAGM